MPAFELCSDMLELLVSTPPASPAVLPDSPTTTTSDLPDSTVPPPEPASTSSLPSKAGPVSPRAVWEAHLQFNKQRWEQEAAGELYHMLRHGNAL